MSAARPSPATRSWSESQSSAQAKVWKAWTSMSSTRTISLAISSRFSSMSDGRILGTAAPGILPSDIDENLELIAVGRAHVELQSLMRSSYVVFCLKKKQSHLH